MTLLTGNSGNWMSSSIAVKEKEDHALGAGPAVAQKLTLPTLPRFSGETKPSVSETVSYKQLIILPWKKMSLENLERWSTALRLGTAHL